MNFLNYMDVAIGIALVMVLVSPAVTAITQVWMWIRNRRSVFLLQMLHRLILQLDASPAALLEATNAGAPLPGIRLDPVGQTDGAGQLWLPDGIPHAHVKNGALPLTLRDGAGNPVMAASVSLRLVPQRSRESLWVSSAPAQAGVAVVSYRCPGYAVHASTDARIRIVNPAGPVTTRAVEWSVDGQLKQRVSFVPGNIVCITCPTAPIVSAAYEVTFTLLDGTGALVSGEVVDVEFLRNERFDRVASAATIVGTVNLPAPSRLASQLALRFAEAVAAHPIIARTPLPAPLTRVPPFRNRQAEVIEREELIRILLELGAGEGAGAERLTAAERGLLLALLTANGIPTPGKTLVEIRAEALQLEKDAPDLATHVRHSRAIAKAAPSDLVGKINHWFDSAVLRATQQYAAEARAVTVAAALLVSLALQFDTLSLLRRLSTNDELRTALIGEARTEQERLDKLTMAGAASPAAAPPAIGNGQTPTRAGAVAPTDRATATSAVPAAGASANENDLVLARSKRDEIERNLATLRSPGLSILPEHFVWQALPRARVMRNPLWTSPYPSSLAMVTGGSTYLIPMRWRRDPLVDLRAAIEASDAPVSTAVESFGYDVLLRSDRPLALSLTDANQQELAVPLLEVAQAILEANYTAWPDSFEYTHRPMCLLVDNSAVPLALTVNATGLFDGLARAIVNERVGVSVGCYGEDRRPLSCSYTPGAPAGDPRRFLVLTATEPHIRDIRLLWNPEDPFSNVLNDTARTARAWRVSAASLKDATNNEMHLTAAYFSTPPGAPRSLQTPAVDFKIKVAPSDADSSKLQDSTVATTFASTLVQDFDNAWKAAAATWTDRRAPSRPEAAETSEQQRRLGLQAFAYAAEDLVISSRRGGPIELRYSAARPETNILNTTVERRSAAWGLLNPATALGILLSWLLLSLGAPFWYDALKNLLKLRPSAAALEERNRAERAANTTAAKRAA
jgi:hypothetical protein